MNSRELIVLKKILRHACRLAEDCKDINDAEEYTANHTVSDACAFNLLQIGELAKNCLSDEIKLLLPDIPWNEIYGLRNRIVHGYAGVEMNIIFSTIKNDIPNLIDEINKILGI